MIPPIDLRELPCPWRKEDSIQKCRNGIPEPSQADVDVWLCRVMPPPILSYAFEVVNPLDFQPVRSVKMRKQLFNYGPGGVNQFWAWTIDGKTPIFPIPMEADDE